MLGRALVLSFAIFFAGAALADGTPATAIPPKLGTVSLDEAHLDEKVCKQMPPKTGSRIPGETICMTNRLWIQLWRDSVHTTHIMQSKPISTNTLPGGGNGGG
jgi:hypothetical protein